MTAEKKAVDLGLLEEDDEFEEFPAEGKCTILTQRHSTQFSNVPCSLNFRMGHKARGPNGCQCLGR